MRSQFIVAFSLLGVGLAQRPADAKSRAAAVVPNQFIIELKDPEGLVKRSTDDGQAEIDKLFADLSELNITAAATLNYTSDVLVGTSVTLSNDTDVERVEKLPQIERVWPVYEFSLPEPLESKVVLEPPVDYNIHIQTGVQKLHDEGNYGEGVIIAVVDTGVDYTHPDLGGGLGPGFKIESGWDFIGKGTRLDPRVPDDNPIDQCQGHGTHVTGIIAANGTRFTGVSPGARIRVYKVGSCYNIPLTLDLLIAAHIKAYKDGADIISTSIGDQSGWPFNIWAVTSNKIAQKGVFVISSAGNSGRDGAFLHSAEAAGEEVIAVGAAFASQLPGLEAIVTDSNGTESTIGYLTQNAAPWAENWPGPQWNTFTPLRTGVKLWTPSSPENTSEKNKDGCEVLSFPYGTKELDGRVVLLRKTDSCTLRIQARAAVTRGAWFILLINDESSPYIPIFTIDDPLMQIGLVTEQVGSELERRLINNETVIVRFPDTRKIVGFPGLPLAGAIDNYSSWGLANDLSIKPDIAAPGSDIFSTWPVPRGRYLIASGTSMSAPYISGVVALYLSAHGGGRSAGKGKSELRDIARSITNRGTPAFWTDYERNLDITEFAPVAQQGGGSIDAYKFVHGNVLFNPNKLALNHTGNLQSKFHITVTNTGREKQLFNITHQPGVTFYTYEEDHLSIATQYPTIIKDKAANASFSTTFLEVAPGEKKSVEVQFTPPTGFNDGRVPVYGGHIKFISSLKDDVFYVPYSGLAIDGTKIYEPTSQGGVFYLTSTLQDISGPVDVNLTTTGVVGEFDLHYGVREAHVELIENATYTNPATFSYPRVPGKNGFVGGVASSFALGRTTAYRAPERLFPGRTFQNGTEILPGVYRYVLRILKPFHEGPAVADWSYVVSPPVTVTL